MVTITVLMAHRLRHEAEVFVKFDGTPGDQKFVPSNMTSKSAWVKKNKILQGSLKICLSEASNQKSEASNIYFPGEGFFIKTNEWPKKNTGNL